MMSAKGITAISLETILLADSSKLIIKRLKIDGFVSSIYKFKVDKIIATMSLWINIITYLRVNLVAFDHALDNAYLGLFDFWLPIETTVAMAPFFILLNFLCVINIEIRKQLS